MEKAALKNVAVFIGKLQTCNIIKKRLQRWCFPLNIAKFLEHLFWRTSADGCFWFLRTATEQQWAAASVLTLLLGSDNLLTDYEQLTY